MLADACSRTAHDEVVRIIERWDAALAVGRGALWSPTIRCAVIAGMPWLDVRRVTYASAVRHLKRPIRPQSSRSLCNRDIGKSKASVVLQACGWS
jgi:hypothetical protein